MILDSLAMATLGVKRKISNPWLVVKQYENYILLLSSTYCLKPSLIWRCNQDSK